MPAKKKPTKSPRVATYLPKEVHALHTHCVASWGKIKADPAHFPTTFPAAIEVEDDLKELGDTIQAAEGGDPVAIAARNAAEAKVRQTFELLGKYVQKVVRAGPVEDAAALIASVLMYESKIGARTPKPPLEARSTETSGSVLLVALAIAGALVYFWESSTDQTTWSASSQTGKARATLAGLTPGKVYWFRVRAFKRDGTTTEWSDSVSLMIT